MKSPLPRAVALCYTSQIESRNTLEEAAILTLHQPKPVWGLPNMSPFCVKLETYLRMAKIEYTVKNGLPFQGPKKKIPFVTFEGQTIGDSSLVIEMLTKKYGDKLDGHLTPLQRAQSLAIQRLIEEHLYFAGAYLRWASEDSWTYVAVVFKSFLPPIVGKFILPKIRKGFLKNIYAQGIGRHTRQEIINFAKQDMEALSVLLGQQKFFFGEQPSSIDAVVYGFLIHQIWVPWESELKAFAVSFPNVVGYAERIRASYWPEYVI